MERLICIHGHFYQPPRENPWLEAVEIQDSATPYHDWNERITAECYAPNSSSRLLDGDGCIIDIVSNYDKISFNFGATLLSWIEKNAPEAYSAIIDADRRSASARSGHGNAIAQSYNHMIMPLASARDKLTQIKWGIADFEYRFRRFPEGMWLPETAVDLETLELLSEHGIKFTILAPHQAAKTRKRGDAAWQDVSGARIDPTRPYFCVLPSGKEIILYFYDGPISRAVAFERLLNQGVDFANRLISGFSDERNWDQLLTIATDGESYGHHHKFGDMALAYALHHIEQNKLATLTNYAEFLEKHPPEYEVRIIENTSWSCAHGIDRWKKNCGCNSGGHPEWNQEWRTPLRKALDWLRDIIAAQFEAKAGDYLSDPWGARDNYIKVILDRSDENISSFLGKNTIRELSASEKTEVLELMEMQRNAMLMYTSCGWFFDELSGIETIQVIYYAARVLQLAEKQLGVHLDKPFRERLAKAKSNIPSFRDGGSIYEHIIKPVIIDLKKVAAHFAISSFISDYPETSKIYNFTVEERDYEKMQTGVARIGVGNITVTSDVTLESGPFAFAALHLGGHIFNAGVKKYRDGKSYGSMKREILTTFEKGNIADMIRHMDQQFGMETYSLVNLFRDEQRKILDMGITKTLQEFEHEYRNLYESHRTLMTFVRETGVPVPKVFTTAAEFTLVSQMKEEFQRDAIDREKVKAIIGDAAKWEISLGAPSLEFTVRKKGEWLIKRLHNAPFDLALLLSFLDYIELLRMLPFEVNYWDMQNAYFDIGKRVYRDFLANAERGSEPAVKWVEAFRRAGDLLFFNIAVLFPEKKTEAVIS